MHFLLQRGDHFARMSFQKIAGLRYPTAILLSADFAQADRDLVSRRFQFALRRRAASKGEDTKFLAHEVERLPQRAGMRIGTKIAAAIVLLESRQAKARPFFRKIDSDDEEAFVVTERDIVSRSILLDQFSFQ